eukprot:CAMPEP_0204279382 /NCGR_PEP_ID=MMETSP0468-20130131/35028_1 /ASSEMBLY_ACC=CAM_ASM_000383 /TAXON_ID=2969 /ORGANISM="Oxyrrhis marina" /LENGTH=100 /DNA_ID=CAMNT_0051256469 /DNA_START=10 /DNA_END=309 /DNA_ORIENTATION=+
MTGDFCHSSMANLSCSWYRTVVRNVYSLSAFRNNNSNATSPSSTKATAATIPITSQLLLLLQVQISPAQSMQYLQVPSMVYCWLACKQAVTFAARGIRGS